jgi:hypothetical protein
MIRRYSRGLFQQHRSRPERFEVEQIESALPLKAAVERTFAIDSFVPKAVMPLPPSRVVDVA